MSPTALSILGVAGSAGIAAAIWLIRCLLKLGDEVATLKASQLVTASEIGNHESGIRGRLHKLENIMTPAYIAWQREYERNQR